MNVSAIFIERPIATALLMAALLVGGAIGYNLLPVAALPTVDFPTIAVSASLAGANPETMASSVAQPLERQFADLPGVNQITSTSVLGSTSITLQFDLSRNIDHLPEFIDSVVDGLYLHLGVGLEFFHCDFRRAYIASGATKGCFAAPTIEEIVAE